MEVSSVFSYGWSHSLQHQFVFNDNDHSITWSDHENLVTQLPMPDKEIAASFNHMDEAAVWLIAAWLASRDGSNLKVSLDGKITHK